MSIIYILCVYGVWVCVCVDVLRCETLAIRSEKTYNSAPANISKPSTETHSVGITARVRR